MRYIEEKDLNRNGITIFRKVLHLEKYDMYYINFPLKNGKLKQVRVFCEKGTFPDFDSEEFQMYQQQYGKYMYKFLIERLIGNNSLLVKEGRDDYIYLGGEFLKDGYLGNRNMIQSNGKTGQENFESNLFKLKLQVEAIEHQRRLSATPQKMEEGKNYVLGDIHGMYGSYLEAIKNLKPNDHLFVIGDVIDRGNGGIKIIQDIMKRQNDRKNNPEITFLLGNHEMQFLDILNIVKKRNLNIDDLININNRKNAATQMRLYGMYSDVSSKAMYAKYQKSFDKYEAACEQVAERKKLAPWEIHYIETWMYTNKGVPTIIDFFDKSVVHSDQERRQIQDFLENSYVVMPKNIKGSDYLFVHAMPPENPKILQIMKQTGKGYRRNELEDDEYRFMLQERYKSTYEQCKQYGFTTICGHTPNPGMITKDNQNGFIRIDAGCGHKKSESKLALYCIEDERVKYIREKDGVEIYR